MFRLNELTIEFPRLNYYVRPISYQNMADTWLNMARPKSLLDLSTHSLFRVISKIIPEHTRKVEWCTLCILNMSNYYDLGVRAQNKKCSCFRYYQQIVDLLCDLPSELNERIVEVAQKELDNSNSVQILLGKKNGSFDLCEFILRLN